MIEGIIAMGGVFQHAALIWRKKKADEVFVEFPHAHYRNIDGNHRQNCFLHPYPNIVLLVCCFLGLYCNELSDNLFVQKAVGRLNGMYNVIVCRETVTEKGMYLLCDFCF